MKNGFFNAVSCSCLTQSLAGDLPAPSCLSPPDAPTLLSSAMEKKHVITIICVVNLVAGRRRKRGIVVAVAPSHLQTSGLVNVMSPASISDSFRPNVRPSVHSPPYLLCSEVAGLRPKVPLRKKKLSRFNHVGVGCFSLVSSHKYTVILIYTPTSNPKLDIKKRF